MFVSILDALALVRLRRSLLTNFSCKLADLLLIRTRDDDLVGTLNSDGDAVNLIKRYRMGITQVHGQGLAGLGYTVANAVNLENLLEALGYTNNHVVDQGTGQTMQPAEVTKIAVILFIPYLICKMGSKVHKLKGSLMVLAWGAVAAFGVFYLTDNLSSAIIVMGIACFILFVVHKKMRPFVIIGGCGVGAFVAIAAVLGKVLENSDNFRLRRIIAWLNPEKYASSLSFQTLQGMYAIGSGGFFGKGLGNSAQKMIIPEVQNDFILTVICEELGVFGAIMVFVLFGLLLYRLLFIAQNAPDLYGALIVTGIFSHIAIQVILWQLW